MIIILNKFEVAINYLHIGFVSQGHSCLGLSSLTCEMIVMPFAFKFGVSKNGIGAIGYNPIDLFA